jgi:hypothetical protein
VAQPQDDTRNLACAAMLMAFWKMASRRGSISAVTCANRSAPRKPPEAGFLYLQTARVVSHEPSRRHAHLGHGMSVLHWRAVRAITYRRVSLIWHLDNLVLYTLVRAGLTDFNGRGHSRGNLGLPGPLSLPLALPIHLANRLRARPLHRLITSTINSMLLPPSSSI